MRCGRSCEAERRSYIDRQLGVEFGIRRLDERCRKKDASGMDQDIERPETSHRFGNYLIRRLVRSDVDAQSVCFCSGAAELGGNSVEAFLVAAYE